MKYNGFLSSCYLVILIYAVKDLLSIPEDEIDYQKMPFKDIILLAGYKEDLAVCTLFPSSADDYFLGSYCDLFYNSIWVAYSFCV